MMIFAILPALIPGVATIGSAIAKLTGGGGGGGGGMWGGLANLAGGLFGGIGAGKQAAKQEQFNRDQLRQRRNEMLENRRQFNARFGFEEDERDYQRKSLAGTSAARGAMLGKMIAGHQKGGF